MAEIKIQQTYYECEKCFAITLSANKLKRHLERHLQHEGPLGYLGGILGGK